MGLWIFKVAGTRMVQRQQRIPRVVRVVVGVRFGGRWPSRAPGSAAVIPVAAELP